MKSHDANDHGATDQHLGQAKKPWITPALEIIALQSAQSGAHRSKHDGTGAHFQRTRS